LRRRRLLKETLKTGCLSACVDHSLEMVRVALIHLCRTIQDSILHNFDRQGPHVLRIDALGDRIPADDPLRDLALKER
jgi:hypothetical protein